MVERFRTSNNLRVSNKRTKKLLPKRTKKLQRGGMKFKPKLKSKLSKLGRATQKYAGKGTYGSLRLLGKGAAYATAAGKQLVKNTGLGLGKTVEGIGKVLQLKGEGLKNIGYGLGKPLATSINALLLGKTRLKKKLKQKIMGEDIKGMNVASRYQSFGSKGISQKLKTGFDEYVKGRKEARQRQTVIRRATRKVEAENPALKKAGIRNAAKEAAKEKLTSEALKKKTRR